MPSSIVTAVPSGILQDWCVQTPWFGDQLQQCANATRGTQESDFQTICCDGAIIDTTRDLYRGGGPINIGDLVCCRVEGPQAGGFGPPPMGAQTTCASGSVQVPLTSLAATNTLNAQDYLVTYTSASFGGPTPGDFIPTTTPYCLWANTKNGVAMSTITLPAPKITTLSSSSYDLPTLPGALSPSVTILTGSATPSMSKTASSSETQSAPTQTTSTSSAASYRSRTRVAAFLGVFCLLAVDILSR